MSCIKLKKIIFVYWANAVRLEIQKSHFDFLNRSYKLIFCQIRWLKSEVFAACFFHESGAMNFKTLLKQLVLLLFRQLERLSLSTLTSQSNMWEQITRLEPAQVGIPLQGQCPSLAPKYVKGLAVTNAPAYYASLLPS